MATKNKNNMDAKSEDDTTSELAIIQSGPGYLDAEAEADASTYAFDDGSPDGKSVANLRSELQSRDQRIGQLQFDAEQLRARWTGLEKEITAREELTETLQAELRDAHQEQVTKDQQLEKNAQEIEALKSRLDELESQISEAESSRKESSANSDFQGQLEKARATVSELNTYIDGRKNDWARLGSELEAHQSELATKHSLLTDLEKTIADESSAREKAEKEITQISARLRKERSRSKQLRKKNRALSLDIGACEVDGQLDFQQRLAEQSGQLVSNNDEIAELKRQIIRSERYADELRNGLKDLDTASNEHLAARQQLDSSLQQATEQVRELREQLDAERLLSGDLEAVNSDLKENFEKEANVIRLELGAAQQTIGDYETVNEELASNLFENAQSRQALESQLHKTAEQRESDVSRLEQKTRRLQSLLEESERKLVAKDSAVSALISELASKSQVIESMDEIGNVIHEIDGKMSERSEERNDQERERPTRLLIGMIEGQELRFPLFKDRLTIGRTQQNDIQLEAQCISRRHAVILSDEDGPRIIDWGSKNGVAVNGAKITEQRLKNGDKVSIGTAEFIFEERPRR